MRGISPISCVNGGIINMFYLLLPNNNCVYYWIGLNIPFPKKNEKNLNFSLRGFSAVTKWRPTKWTWLRREGGYAKSPRRNWWINGYLSTIVKASHLLTTLTKSTPSGDSLCWLCMAFAMRWNTGSKISLNIIQWLKWNEATIYLFLEVSRVPFITFVLDL